MGVNAVGLPTVKCVRFVCENLTTFLFSKCIVGKPICGLFGDIFSFSIKVGVYEKLAKCNDCSTKPSAFAAKLPA